MYTLKNKFSWSYSRYALFQFCERAYYFNHYGSWNGWDTYATDYVRYLYQLKNLTSKELWLANSIRKSFIFIFNKSIRLNSQLFYSEFKKHLHKSLKYDLNILTLKKWQDDPKSLCINEIYYKKMSLDELYNWLKIELDIRLEAIHKSKLIEYLIDIPYSAFINKREILSFDFRGFPVWCSPVLTWKNKGKINFLNFNFLNESVKLSLKTDYQIRNVWAMLMGINCLFAKQLWTLDYNNVICRTLFIDGNNSFSVYGHRSLKEVEGIILESSRLMKSKLTCDEKAYAENFPETENREKCQNCSFFEVCYNPKLT